MQFIAYNAVVLGRSHYLLFALCTAMYPRVLMTFDENLQQIKTAARVGLAVDIAGQAGRPKTITGTTCIFYLSHYFQDFKHTPRLSCLHMEIVQN